jgi:hypothetical protein
MAKLKKNTPALLEFSFEDCPDEKLVACCEYEYRASSRLIREAAMRFQAGATDPVAKAVDLLFGPDIHWTFAPGLWPRPYLTLVAEREPTSASHQSGRRRQSLSKLDELVAPWTYLLDPKETERVVAVYINPYLSLPKLQQAFAALLCSHYSHLVAHKSRPKAAFLDLLQRKNPAFFNDFVSLDQRIHKRGRGSQVEQARANLKALSAWRLQKQFGYTAKSAIELLPNGYRDQRAYRRAVAKASEKITELETQLHRYADTLTA